MIVFASVRSRAFAVVSAVLLLIAGCSGDNTGGSRIGQIASQSS
jgi:hypothetical protein